MARKGVNLMMLTAALLCSFIGTGFALHIDITPNEVNGLVQNEVNILCEVDGLESHIQEIMILELSKNDVPIVILRQNSQVSIGKGLVAKFQAEGSIAKSVNSSYIHVTVSNPTVEDSGSYTCLLYFLDEMNQLQETRRSAGLTVSNLDLKSAVMFLVDKVTHLESELTLQKNNFSAKLEEQKKESTYRENELQEQMLALTNQVDIQRKQLDHYTNTSGVYFKATHTTSGAFDTGDDVIYSQVTDNIGDAYDGNTGVFTAPVTGYYLFAVSVSPQNGKYVFLDLKSSDDQVIGRLFSMGYSDINYSQSSCVTRLNAGETVRPVIKRASGFTMYSEETNGPLNTFYGFLLKKL